MKEMCPSSNNVHASTKRAKQASSGEMHRVSRLPAQLGAAFSLRKMAWSLPRRFDHFIKRLGHAKRKKGER
jgi:hypothetical protein